MKNLEERAWEKFAERQGFTEQELQNPEFCIAMKKTLEFANFRLYTAICEIGAVVAVNLGIIKRPKW